MIFLHTQLKIKKILYFLALVLCAFGLTQTMSVAQEDNHRGPRAAERSYGQNFKDMAFAHCLGKAYGGDELITRDIASSHGALIEWTYYDLAKAPEAVTNLVQAYLAQDYSNPLAEQEAPGLEFNYLKCLDLYHSQELDGLMREVVAEPESRIR